MAMLPIVTTDMRVLLANEPRAYREVIAAALQARRRHVDVVAVEPAGLDGAVARLAPHLVVCSRPPEAVPVGPLAWVVLYPGGAPQAVVSIAGHRTTVEGIDFDGLLAIVDRTERLAQMS